MLSNGSSPDRCKMRFDLFSFIQNQLKPFRNGVFSTSLEMPINRNAKPFNSSLYVSLKKCYEEVLVSVCFECTIQSLPTDVLSVVTLYIQACSLGHLFTLPHHNV